MDNEKLEKANDLKRRLETSVKRCNITNLLDSLDEKNSASVEISFSSKEKQMRCHLRLERKLFVEEFDLCATLIRSRVERDCEKIKKEFEEL